MANIKYRIQRVHQFSSRLSLRITPANEVVVRAPFWLPHVIIEKFVDEKTSWILKHLRSNSTAKEKKQYIDGEKHLFFGQEYPLKIIKIDTPGRHSVSLEAGSINIFVNDRCITKEAVEKIKQSLLHWYLEKGIEVITDRVNHYSKKIGVDYQKINLKKVSSIWGSCSHRKTLSFNRKLVMAPKEIVDYVIIHEVSHLRVPNHGVTFWKLVETHDPFYKQHRQWLRKNHHLLDI